MNRNISIIVAVDDSGGFGKEGKLPWYFPEDLANFKKLTTNATCLMGRLTYDDIKSMQKTEKASVQSLYH